MKTVAINGYGTIGKRVADAVAAYARDEEDLNVKKENLGSYTYYEIMSEYGNSLDLGVADKAAVLRLRVNALDGGLRMKDSFAAMFANGGPEKTEGLKEFYDAEQDVAVWVALDAALDSAMPLIEEELDYASVSKLQAYAQMYDDASAVFCAGALLPHPVKIIAAASAADAKLIHLFFIILTSLLNLLE